MKDTSSSKSINIDDLNRLRQFLRRGINISIKSTRHHKIEKIQLTTDECDRLLAKHATGLWLRYRHHIDPSQSKITKENSKYKYIKKAEIALNEVVTQKREALEKEQMILKRRNQIKEEILAKKLKAEREIARAELAQKKVSERPKPAPRTRTVQRSVLATPIITGPRNRNAYDMGSPEVNRLGSAANNEIDDLFD